MQLDVIPNAPMHRVLSVPEILTLICHCSTLSTLASLVRVNRTFKEIALPALWYEQDSLVPLARCFGDAIEEKSRPGLVNVFIMQAQSDSQRGFSNTNSKKKLVRNIIMIGSMCSAAKIDRLT